MEIRYTKHFLNKLEDLFAESEYILRYEKGNFKSGYCVLRDSRIAVINKFYSLEGKINCIIEILREIDLDPEGLSDKNKSLLHTIKQTEPLS